jgi:hypothetical protein
MIPRGASVSEPERLCSDAFSSRCAADLHDPDTNLTT